MKRTCAKILSLMVLLAAPALASNWEECKMDVMVNHATEQGYNITIQKGVVTNGMANIGGACLQGTWGTPMDIALDGNLTVGAMTHLDYARYSAMGANGPVNSETWKVTQVK